MRLSPIAATAGCALIATVAIGAVMPERPGAASAQRPVNVILLLTDTVRADRIGAYGHARNTSPVFDQLAKEGVLFTNAYAPSPWTRPSVASLFSGLYPQRHGVQMRQDKLPESVPTLAELLHDAGYQTTALTTNPHVTHTWGLTRGFERVVEIMPDADKFKAGNGAALVYKKLRAIAPSLREPFMLYVHLIDPHWPYEPPRHDMKVLGITAENPSDLARYDGELHFADRYLGHMLRLLEAHGLTDNAIVVMTSDHGDEFREHGSIGHGKTLHQEVVKVPLAMRLPQSLAGRLAPYGDADRPRCSTIESNVSLVDIMPTLLSLTGVPIPSASDGEDLTPLMQCEPATPRPLYFSVDKERVSYAGVLLETTKLIVNRINGEQRLYAIDLDPFEQRDGAIGADQAEAAERLGAILESFEWSARPGLHLEIAGKDGVKDRREMVVRLKTNGRFVNVRTRDFERHDRVRLSDDETFMRIDTVLTAFWHRSPKHVWVQDRDELIFDVEPPDAAVQISIRIDGKRAHTAIMRFPRAESNLWPQTFTPESLLGGGRPSLVDRRRAGVYFYGQRQSPVEQVQTVSQNVSAALRALGYVQ